MFIFGLIVGAIAGGVLGFFLKDIFRKLAELIMKVFG